MAARRGDTLLFPTPPVVAAHAAIGGKKEGEGPLAACFDELSADNFFGQSNWEAAEKEMALRAARLCLKKAETTPDKVSLALAGDLQAQCTASSYALRELGIPFVGLFGACSTMAEALGLGAQFAARFGFTVAEETVALCRTMDLSALSRERVEGELQKALLPQQGPVVLPQQGHRLLLEHPAHQIIDILKVIIKRLAL